MIFEIYEKDGQTWYRMTDGSGRFVDGPSRIKVVKGGPINDFRKLVSLPEVEKAMLDCKKACDEKRATSNSGA